MKLTDEQIEKMALEKRELRRALVDKQISIAELSRRSGVSRYAIKIFRDTGKINPATFARMSINCQLNDIVRKGEE